MNVRKVGEKVSVIDIEEISRPSPRTFYWTLNPVMQPAHVPL
jgi:hypothetical protein